MITETNIPIYRAKKIDSDEYVIGWYSEPIVIDGKLHLSITNKDGTWRIDPLTLAIHFPDMIDSDGSKMFASLQKDSKGGDFVELTYEDYGYTPTLSVTVRGLCKIEESSFIVDNLSDKKRAFYDEMGCNFTNKDLTIVGIQT